jgi:aspartyl protease family protein
MALTSGNRQLLREAASWAVVALIGAAAFSHFETLKTGAEQLLGLPTPSDIDARTDARTAAQSELPAPQQQASSSIVELKAGRNGHFNAEAEVNGRSIDVMVDTGATMIALTYEDAQRAGLSLNNSDFTQAVTTANGVARVAPVTLDRVSIGDITVRNVPAAVAERGRLKTSLLGMTFLSRLSRFDMRAGILVLQE